jgi:hypothetical protein
MRRVRSDKIVQAPTPAIKIVGGALDHFVNRRLHVGDKVNRLHYVIEANVICLPKLFQEILR